MTCGCVSYMLMLPSSSQIEQSNFHMCTVLHHLRETLHISPNKYPRTTSKHLVLWGQGTSLMYPKWLVLWRQDTSGTHHLKHAHSSHRRIIISVNHQEVNTRKVALRITHGGKTNFYEFVDWPRIYKFPLPAWLRV